MNRIGRGTCHIFSTNKKIIFRLIIIIDERASRKHKHPIRMLDTWKLESIYREVNICISVDLWVLTIATNSNVLVASRSFFSIFQCPRDTASIWVNHAFAYGTGRHANVHSAEQHFSLPETKRARRTHTRIHFVVDDTDQPPLHCILLFSALTGSVCRSVIRLMPQTSIECALLS